MRTLPLWARMNILALKVHHGTDHSTVIQSLVVTVRHGGKIDDIERVQAQLGSNFVFPRYDWLRHASQQQGAYVTAYVDVPLLS